MEIRNLQHFIALAEEGKFTTAAQRMNIVQSGLSVSSKSSNRSSTADSLRAQPAKSH
jgi:hypothetical protein